MRHTRRLVFLQYMRGIAALAVAIGHLTWPLTNLPTLSKFLSPDDAKLATELAAGTWLPRVYEWMPSSQYFVHCFFMLSGFVIHMSLRSTTAAGFLIQRGFRLYPALWVASLLAILSSVIAGKAIPNAGVVAGEILLVRGYDLNPVVWTLLIEARFYVATALFLAIGCSIRTKTTVLGVALALLSIANLALTPSFALQIWTSTLFYLVWMHSGSLTYEVWAASRERERGPAVRLLAAHLLLFVACYILLHKAGFLAQKDASINPGTLSAALLTLILLVFGEHYVSRRSRLLEWVGDISYPLYLLHIPVGWLVFSLVFRTVGSTLGVLIGSGSVLLMAALVHTYVEQPMNLIGKQVARRLMDFRRRPHGAAVGTSADSPG